MLGCRGPVRRPCGNGCCGSAAAQELDQDQQDATRAQGKAKREEQQQQGNGQDDEDNSGDHELFLPVLRATKAPLAG
jgi:hypothetical protein